MRCDALHVAFAAVHASARWSPDTYRTTDDADPRNIYHNVLTALIEKLGPNLAPTMARRALAFVFERLEVASGRIPTFQVRYVVLHRYSR